MSCFVLMSWMWEEFDLKWPKILQLLFLTTMAIITDGVTMYKICVEKYVIPPVLAQILNRPEEEEKSTIMQISQDLANHLKIFKNRVAFFGETKNQVLKQIGGEQVSAYDLPRYVEINLVK